MGADPVDGLRRIPDFLIIGAMRCGTSVLFKSLLQHPELRMSRIKEPYYFVDDKSNKGTWRHGEAWYRDLFPPGTGPCGEASTLYSRIPSHPGVVDRIHSYNPNTKFIYLVRQPVERALSHYFHSVLKGLDTHSILEALAPSSHSSYVTAGLYHLQLAIYLTRFRRSSFHIVVSEDLWRQPEATLRSISEFLDISSHALTLPAGQARNSTRNLFEKLRSGKRAIQNKVQEDAVRMIESMDDIENVSPSMLALRLGFTSPYRALLESCFAADTARLEAFLGRKISVWRKV